MRECEGGFAARGSGRKDETARAGRALLSRSVSSWRSWPGRARPELGFRRRASRASRSSRPRPCAGGGIDRDKVPALAQTLSPRRISTAPIQPERSPIRCSSASPASTRRTSRATASRPGHPLSRLCRLAAARPAAGLAVYMNGIRINEAFGDTVNCDLIPTNAIDRADIQTNNPVFGLNALGGAINLQMKNGFTYQGSEAEAQGGSFGRVSAGLQFGGEKDDVGALHRGAGRERRRLAPAFAGQVARFYGDLGWRHDGTEVHLVGCRRLELLRRGRADADRTARAGLELDLHVAADDAEPDHLVALNGKFDVHRELDVAEQCLCPAFQAAARRRQRRRRRALQQRAIAFPNTLCLEDDGFPRAVTPAFRNQFAILDQNNNPIPCPPAAATPARRVPYGTIDRTATDATDGRRFAAGHQRREAVRPRQPLHRRRQHRPQLDRLHRRARSASSIRICSSDRTRRSRATARSSIRSAISASARSASTRSTPISASMPPTRSTSRRNSR